MGSLAQIAARRAAPAATKVAGAATPAPVAKPSTTTAPKRETPPAAPAAKTAPPAKKTEPPASSMPLVFVDEEAAKASAVPKYGTPEFQAAEGKRIAGYAQAREDEFYRKKLEDVARLRREKVIGPTNAPAAMYDIHPMFQEPEGVTRSDKLVFTAGPKPGMPEFEVYPRPGNVYSPDDETMAKIEAFRDTAKLQGVEYRRAMREAAEQDAKIEAALKDPTFDRRKLPELARAKKELTQRLAERRASLREMGFMTDEEMNAKFLK
jgi:hypothetical protein